MNVSIHLVIASPPRGEMLKPWEQTRTGTPCKPQVEPLATRLGFRTEGRAKTESTEKLKEDLQAVRWSSCSMPWSCAASHATSHLLPVMAGPQGPSQTLSHNRETPLALLLEGCGESRGECTKLVDLILKHSKPSILRAAIFRDYVLSSKALMHATRLRTNNLLASSHVKG